MNKVMLVGRIGQDVEFKNVGGNSLARTSLATTEKWNDKDGQKQESTEWHKLVVWGKLSEVFAKYIAKGMKVTIFGKIKSRSWEKDDGTKGYVTEIVVSEVDFERQAQSNEPTTDDEIPF